MKAALLLAAVILYGGCSATPTEVSSMKKPSQSENSEAMAVSSNSARATATTSSTLTKTSSKSSAQASVGNSVRNGNQESGGIKGQNNSGGRGSVGFGDQESESDYIGKNYPNGGYDPDGEYEEQDDGFSNQEENGNYNDIDVSSQSQENARGDIGSLSAALLLAHHANLAHLLHLSHNLYLPEIIGLNLLTRGVPGGGLMNLWPLHHLTNHKLKELVYFNALSKSLPNFIKTSMLGQGKAMGLQLPGLQMIGKGGRSQDARNIKSNT